MQRERAQLAAARVAKDEVANPRTCGVDVRRDPAPLERVQRATVRDLREVDVLGPGRDVAEHRLLPPYPLPVVHRELQVEVLEGRVAPRRDRHRRPVQQPRPPGRDRVDGRPRARVDVDPVVEPERAGPFESVLAEREQEGHPRVAEVPADRMLAVERLQRPRVGLRAAGRCERHHQT